MNKWFSCFHYLNFLGNRQTYVPSLGCCTQYNKVLSFGFVAVVEQLKLWWKRKRKYLNKYFTNQNTIVSTLVVEIKWLLPVVPTLHLDKRLYCVYFYYELPSAVGGTSSVTMLFLCSRFFMASSLLSFSNSAHNIIHFHFYHLYIG